jgi:restriction system protein
VLEKHIEEFVKDNLKILDLELYNDEEGDRTGQQYDTFIIGRMDLLCLDEKKDFVVIELKKGRESDKVVGQILRYYMTFGQSSFFQQIKVNNI